MKINLLEYFEQTVSQYPKRIAILENERKISFSELRNKSYNLANKIINLINCINRPVAVFLPKSIECIIADIAITYSGNCYMNLDLKTPSTRLKNIIERINPVLFITDRANYGIINEVNSESAVILWENLSNFSEVHEKLIFQQISQVIDTDPLCIINTSGSTGTPKGAVLNHKSYIDYAQWAINTFKFTGDEVLGVLSPIVFDHYNYEICLMMTEGCTLVLLDNRLAAFPVKILESLIKYDVTYIFWVPSIMVNIANMDLLSKIPLTKIAMVWFAGEVFPTKQFNYWRKWLPQATFVNLYGPVETTVDCTYYIIDREIKDEEPIPIGFPCRNTDILILNDLDKRVNKNELGELCVRGTSLAMGYYNDFEKTNKSFVQNPLNTNYPELIYRTGDLVYINELGEIIFKGRKDTQIKHLGYRIELGEIEHILVNNLKIIDNGCVIYNHEKKEIVLFYESKNNISAGDIRKSLLEILPKYMLPSQFYKRDELPRNVNGKIDRLLLTELLYDRKKSNFF
jgi:amino acid adenylation domain-containing protein